MPGPKYDLEDGDIIIDMGGNMGMDSDGHMMIKMGGNMAMDMETGDLHIVSGWDDDDEDDD